MKEWKCVEVGHHKDCGKTIEEWQKNGWCLHTYACAPLGGVGGIVKHYLLFERENGKKPRSSVKAAAATN